MPSVIAMQPCHRVVAVALLRGLMLPLVVFAASGAPECPVAPRNASGSGYLLAINHRRSQVANVTTDLAGDAELAPEISVGRDVFSGNLSKLPEMAKLEAEIDGWLDDDDTGDDVDDGALVAETQRSLLSTRAQHVHTLAGARRGCSNCLCLLESAVYCGTSVVTDAALCGTSVVTDAALCGTETVTDAAKCGVSIFKSCKWSRRRRLGKLKCSFSEVAKTCEVATNCNVANSCPIANKCDVASSFSECFEEVAGKITGATKDYAKLITDSGCSSPAKCRDSILEGLEGAWSLVSKELQEELEGAVSSALPSSALNTVKNLYSTIKTAGSEVAGAASDIADEIAEYFKGNYGDFQKYDLGTICSAEGVGFWYMEPTDCGTFDEMAEIFGDMTNAASHFSSALSKLGTCLRKTGLLQVPTPFFDLKVESFCLPSALKTPLEYFLGTMVYAGDVAGTAVSDMKSIFSKLEALVSSVNFMQIGRNISDSKRRREASDVHLLETQRASAECGLGSDWALTLYVGVNFDGSRFTMLTSGFSFSMGIIMGCKDDKVITPNWVLDVELAFGAFLPRMDASTLWEYGGGVHVGVKWQHDYVNFQNRWAMGAGLAIIPEVEVAEVFAVDSPIQFMILPSDVPSGFDVSLRPTGEAEVVLQQLGRETTAAAASALGSRAANTQGSTFLAMASAISSMAASDFLAPALAPQKAWFDVAHQNALLQSSLAIERRGEELVGQALSKASTKQRQWHSQGKAPSALAPHAELVQKEAAVPLEVSLSIAATLATEICITPGQCFGS
eukprot:TRINITY_DN3595_c0_g1_i2.p1 TRINITY_DN3595_c0_g1~~TRINITY_DN3595_c0_g1_i2.p1  ORF type:complete len:790 (+),score=135.62 TRINITY_DN3595_c0_g1_i2:87-2456(+)